jgi:UDP-2,3-diacylglucosamine hydrolase
MNDTGQNQILEKGKKIYFASDFHLGAHSAGDRQEREKLIVRWLDEIQMQTASLYLLGDVFDFWFEYRKAVPRGFVRFLGKLAEFSDAGIPVHFFTGNHDVWIFDYLPREIGLTIHRKPYSARINGKNFYLAHGDGLGPGDRRFKLLKQVFTNSFAQWLFGRLHPNLGIALAQRWSLSSRNVHEVPEEFRGEEGELLLKHSRQVLKQMHYDFFVYGHRHIPVDYPLNAESRYINLGDWISHFTYGVFDGENFALKKYV